MRVPGVVVPNRKIVFVLSSCALLGDMLSRYLHKISKVLEFTWELPHTSFLIN